MLQCDARNIYMLKTIEFLDFGEIFRGPERATIMLRSAITPLFILEQSFHNVIMQLSHILKSKCLVNI